MLTLTQEIIDYETGTMDAHDVPAFFCKLYNSGMLAHLPGRYGRTMQALYAGGHIVISAENIASVRGV